MTTFANDEGYDELVIARDIPVRSLCAHIFCRSRASHTSRYLPDRRILGLSKLAHVTEMFSRGLQVQERLTTQIGAWLNDQLRPKGVGVVIEAEHLCMTIRGVQARQAPAPSRRPCTDWYATTHAPAPSSSPLPADDEAAVCRNQLSTVH